MIANDRYLEVLNAALDGGLAGGTLTGYASIYRFKGREAPAVVPCDIDPLGEWRGLLDFGPMDEFGVGAG